MGPIDELLQPQTRTQLEVEMTVARRAQQAADERADLAEFEAQTRRLNALLERYPHVPKQRGES